VIDPMLSRDIKKLVGRAGRAGATTKGLVICANADDWPAVERNALSSTREYTNPVNESALQQAISWRMLPVDPALVSICGVKAQETKALSVQEGKRFRAEAENLSGIRC
jgi:hypothetical protein